MKRDSYLDTIKLLFAIMILFFHAGNEIFPGGRIAVEGYFMISGYFMMISIAKAAGKEDSLGVSTVKFLRHKYVTLAQYLIPAVLIAVCAFVAAGKGCRFHSSTYRGKKWMTSRYHTVD